MSRKYPAWIKQHIEKISTYLITKSNVNDIIPIIKQAFEDLDYGRFDAKDMQFTEQLDKHANHYPNDKDKAAALLCLGARLFLKWIQ
jgi:DNA polymerase elongation subunit (family B)